MTQASLAQHGMWVTATTGASTTAYHMPLVIRFGDGLDVAALARACADVVRRHPLLATAIDDREGVAHLVPAPAPALRLAQPGESIDDEIGRPFDVAAGPLARFVLFDASTLVITAHHLAFDGQSKDILVRDLAAFYGGDAPAPLHVTFADHAEAERARVEAGLSAAAAFWQSRWSEPVPLVVADRLLTSRHAGPGEVVEFSFDAPQIDGVTRFEAVLAAVHSVLFGYGNTRVSTAIDLSTRAEATGSVVGPMVNELPVDSAPRADAPFAEFARSLRATLRETYPHRDVPLARAVPRIRPHAALAPISVSYRRRGPEPEFARVSSAVEWTVFNGAVRGDLQLQIVDNGKAPSASLRFSPAAADVAPVFVEHLRGVARGAAADPTTRLSDLMVVAGVHVPGVATLPGTTTAGAATAGADIGAVSDEQLADQIRAIWEDVLKISPIGDKDDLFDLGGHSLTITQIIARMRKNLNIEVSMDVFFDDPTINGVVDAVINDR